MYTIINAMMGHGTAEICFNHHNEEIDPSAVAVVSGKVK